MMAHSTHLSQQLASQAAACDQLEVLQHAHIGEGDWRNELVLFIKPEAFMLESTAYTTKVIDLVQQKLHEFDAQVSGVALIGGQLLDRLEIMNAHYGLINRLSRKASQMLGVEDQQKIATALDMSIDDYAILGGHEYLAQYPGETSRELDTLWFSGRSTKIRSGFYVKPVEKDARKLLLVNAFHPEQLNHFTDPSHRIALFLIHSNNDWAALKNQMVGATFPDKADPGSIRGILHAQASNYGFESVTIANNVVHLSAGPFEALFEIVNFFGKLFELDVRKTQPIAVKRMQTADLSLDQALAALDNPIVTETPKPTDLFSATEDMDTDPAIGVYKDFLQPK